MPHFFISYAKKETRDLAISLSDALNALPNVTAWVDLELEIGRSWETQIQREIKKCDYFVVLYSPDLNRHLEDESLSESYILNEITSARMLNKSIIPVMAQIINELPISLNLLQYIDYTVKGFTLDDLVATICHAADIQLQNNHPGRVAPFVLPRQRPKHEIGDIFPQTFDWCKIPSGTVTVEGKTELVPGFSIAKYPITNAQYAKFIEAEGYKNEQWWTKAGWTQKVREKWTEPRWWRDNDWNGAEQPVVGVSWYEALAFCRWLSETIGEKILLPTEQEWQRAAQGDDRRIYPWGNTWDNEKCNNSVSPKSSKVTSSVKFYEDKGNISPYKVVDMAGNVREWCLNKSEIGKSIRVLRGGSWFIGIPDEFRVDHRSWEYPENRDKNWGFRITLS